MEDRERDEIEPDIQDLISRWAGESKRLLVALPGVLAKLEDLRAESDGLRQRVADLEHDNQTLRQSREELAETFAKLKALISGTTVAEAVTDGETHRPRPTPPAPRAVLVGASVESASRDGETDGEPASAPPAPAAATPAPPNPDRTSRFPAREDKPAPAKSEESAPASAPVRFSSVFRPPSRS